MSAQRIVDHSLPQSSIVHKITHSASRTRPLPVKQVLRTLPNPHGPIIDFLHPSSRQCRDLHPLSLSTCHLLRSLLSFPLSENPLPISPPVLSMVHAVCRYSVGQFSRTISPSVCRAGTQEVCVGSWLVKPWILPLKGTDRWIRRFATSRNTHRQDHSSAGPDSLKIRTQTVTAPSL